MIVIGSKVCNLCVAKLERNYLSDVLLFICGLTAILGANINEKMKQF